MRASASETSIAESDPVPSSTMSARHRRKAFLSGGVGAEAAIDLHHEGDDRERSGARRSCTFRPFGSV